MREDGTLFRTTSLFLKTNQELPERFFMLIEMHAHTSRYSPCSQIAPVDLVKQVVAKGLQGVVITEHHYVWQASEIAELRREAEVPDSFLIFSAQEVSVSGFGHVLVFGVSETIKDKFSLEVLTEMYPEAVFVWAHPFRKGNIPSDEKLKHPLLHGIEIFSLNHTTEENYRALQAWHTHKFTAMSGSDSHSYDMTGVFPTQFDHPVTTIDDLTCELRHGRCRPFFKEIPKSGTNVVVTEITIGTKGADESRSRIIVKRFAELHKWEKAQETATLNAELYESGFNKGIYRVPKIIQVNENEQMIIEEGQRGRSLFELLTKVHPKVGYGYWTLSSEWLAKLHDCRLSISAIEETMTKEKKRFHSYAKSFQSTHSPYCVPALAYIDLVAKKEETLLQTSTSIVQVHGDFHPKNIIIGQDQMHDASTVFVSVIDFGNSLLMPCAFDVGYFLAQCAVQFLGLARVREAYTDDLFLRHYFDARKNHSENGSYEQFAEEVTFFKMRSFLSIANYLIKVGKGTSPDMAFIFDELKRLQEQSR